MDEDGIVSDDVTIIRGVGDVLSPGFLGPFSDGSCEYASVEHYFQCSLLSHMGLIPESMGVLEEKTAAGAAARAQAAIRASVPPALDPGYLANYLSLCRDSFVRRGFTLRFDNSPDFKAQLMKTGKSLLVYCDATDKEHGVGMDEVSFKYWMQQEGVSTTMLYKWMLRPDTQPLSVNESDAIGRNRLGLILMELRDGGHPDLGTAAPAEAAASAAEPAGGAGMERRTFTQGLVTVSDLLVALRGPFLPLSNRYAIQITIHGFKYRSVEHYVYYKFLGAYGVNEKEMEKVRTTASPWKLHHVVEKLLNPKDPDFDTDKYGKCCEKLEKWYRRGMTAKFTRYPKLSQLLLATGDSFLIETEGRQDSEWSIGTSEREVQHILSKPYMEPDQIMRWTSIGGDRPPKNLRNIGLNKTGTILMEMRKLFLESEMEPLALEPGPDPAITSLITEHLICFTPESVFSPLAPQPFKHETHSYPSVQHFILAQGATQLNFSEAVRKEILDMEDSHAASVKWAAEVQNLSPPPDDLYQWFLSGESEAAKKGLRLRLEQQPGLLRALLDTQDALLVYTLRYLSSQLHWGIGMREKDLRSWMHLRGIPTSQLATMTALPLSKRPPFLGGNRLGWILMELRREFTLRGVFPQNLPELMMSPEVILGSDSILEDMDTWDDELPVPHQDALWPNPFLLQAKRSTDKRLITQALFRRPQPPWLRQIPPPDEAEAGVEEEMVAQEPPNTVLSPRKTEREMGAVTEEEMDAMTEQELRGFILAYISKLRGLHQATIMQNQQLRYLESELLRLKSLREQLEAEEREGRAEAKGPERGERAEKGEGGKGAERGEDGLTEEERNLRLVQERMAQLVQSQMKAAQEPKEPPKLVPKDEPKTQEEPELQAKVAAPVGKCKAEKTEKVAPKVEASVPSPKEAKVPKEDAEDGEISSSDDD